MTLFANRLLNIRLFSVFLVFLCYSFFDLTQFENIVVCFGLAHYAVAAWSSRNHFVAFRLERPVRLLWDWCPVWPFVGLFVLSGLWLAHSLLRKPESELKTSQIFSDSLLVVLVAASFFFRMNIKWLVLYHIFIWTFIPSIHLSVKNTFKHVYAPMIVLCTAIMIIAPRLLAYWNMQNSTLLWNFTYWGHLHHGVTLVLFLKTRTLGFFQQNQPGVVMNFPAAFANEVNSGTG